MTDASTERRVDVYVRERVPPAVSETVEATVERFRELERDGAIEELCVDSWGVCDGRHSDESVVSTLDEFESWADRADRSLRPAFDRREVSSMFAEGSVRRLEVPIVAAAVYESDQLRCVTPCSDGDETYTVRDCLDALSAADDAPTGGDAPGENDSAAVSGPLVNVG